jgi:hypothetical protein
MVGIQSRFISSPIIYDFALIKSKFNVFMLIFSYFFFKCEVISEMSKCT